MCKQFAIYVEKEIDELYRVLINLNSNNIVFNATVKSLIRLELNYFKIMEKIIDFLLHPVKIHVMIGSFFREPCRWNVEINYQTDSFRNTETKERMKKYKCRERNNGKEILTYIRKR